MKCIVHNCQNTNKQGGGVCMEVGRGSEVWICNPCFNFIIKGLGKDSQIFKNVEQILKEQK